MAHDVHTIGLYVDVILVPRKILMPNGGLNSPNRCTCKLRVDNEVSTGVWLV